MQQYAQEHVAQMRRINLANWRVTLVGLVVVALVLGGAVALSQFSRSAKASSGGGGGCSPDPNGAPTCSFKGFVAGGGFSQTDSTGCIVTNAGVLVLENVTHSPPGGPTTSGSGAFVGIFQYNYCTYTFVQDAFGEASTVTFHADSGLQGATANGTATVTDYTTGATYPVSFNLTWKGQGSITTVMNSSSLRTADTLLRTRFQGSSRFAVVSGAITESGTSLAAAHGTGNLIQSDGGTIIVTH